MTRQRDYGGLGAIIDQVIEEGVRVETTCPNHGEPFQVDDAGVKNCPFGDYRIGVRSPHVPKLFTHVRNDEGGTG